MTYQLTALLFAAFITPVAADCGPDSAEYEEARQASLAFDQLIKDPSSTLKATQAAFTTLLNHRCVRDPTLTKLDPETPDSVLAMRRWWNQGGEGWIDQLRAYQEKPTEALPFPPPMPKTLALDLTPSHPARAILCRSDDPACGTSTRGWISRLKAHEKPGAQPSSKSLAACAKQAKAEKKDYQFSSWASCVAQNRPQSAQLPAGHFRAPDKGWLAIRGRRGHYSFCDGIWLFDLKTGAAYVSESCSRLVLMTHGQVAHKATNAARDPGKRAGMVSRDNIREALWMMILADSTTNAPTGHVSIAPPKWLKPVNNDSFMGMGSSGWGTSAQTQLSWLWFDGELSLASGALTWPNSSNLGENYAAELLRIAEAGLVEGCPEVAPPADIPFGPRPGVSSLDAKPNDLARAVNQAVRGLKAARSQACN